VQVALRGTLLFEFQETGETYLAQIPDLYIRFFGLGGGYNENVGKVRFERVSGGTTGDATKLWADCHFKPRGSAGWKSKAHRMDCTVYREDCVGLVCCDTGNDVSVSSIPGTDSPIAAGAGVVGLGFGFLENFGDKSCATFQSAKAASRKFAAKNFVPEKNTTNVQMLLSLKGHYNSEVRNLVTGELFWQAAKRKRLNPVAATVPIDLETESHLVWGDLIKSIVKEDWKKANLAKKRVEVAQRALMKVRPCAFPKSATRCLRILVPEETITSDCLLITHHERLTLSFIGISGNQGRAEKVGPAVVPARTENPPRGDKRDVHPETKRSQGASGVRQRLARDDRESGV
jgi:hypothetical protein